MIRYTPSRVTMAGAALACVLTILGCTQAAQSFQAKPVEKAAGRHMTVGVDLYVNHAYTGDAETLATRDLAYLRDALGVRNVQIIWNLQSEGNQVRQGADTPSAQVVGTVTNVARDDGLNVSYRVMFSVPSGRSDRINPTNSSAWFASLYAAEKPYLEVAQRTGVREFIAGTEHTTIEDNPLWGRFFVWASSVYHGTLSYTSWGGRPGYGGVFGGNLSELPPVTDYGLTAYPKVNLPADASQEQVTVAWEAFLRHLPVSVRSRTALDEVGIPAAAGAYNNPWNWDAYNGAADNDVQVRWFTAVCTAAAAEHLRGVWFFPMFLDDNPVHPYPGLAKFENRPASEAAIRTCAQNADG